MIIWILCIFFSAGAATFLEYQHQLVDAHDDPRLLYNAAVAAAQENQLDPALSYFNQAKMYQDKLMPEERKQLWYNTGNAYALLKNKQKALEEFERIEKEFPGDERVREKISYLKSEEPEKQPEEKEQSKDDSSNDTQDQSSKGNNEDQKGNKQDQEDGKQQQAENTQADSEQKPDNAKHKRQDKARDEAGHNDQEQKTQQRDQKHNNSPQKDQNMSSQSSKKMHKDRGDELVEALMNLEKNYQKEMIKVQAQGFENQISDKNW